MAVTNYLARVPGETGESAHQIRVAYRQAHDVGEGDRAMLQACWVSMCWHTFSRLKIFASLERYLVVLADLPAAMTKLEGQDCAPLVQKDGRFGPLGQSLGQRASWTKLAAQPDPIRVSELQLNT